MKKRKMRYKIISLILIILLTGSSVVAFARAERIDYRSIVEVAGRKTANDLFFEEFVTTDEGKLPSTISAVGSGKISVEKCEMPDGTFKNCLKIDDVTHDNAYNGPRAEVPLTNANNTLVGFEYRFKYIPTGTSTFNSVEFRVMGDEGLISRVIVASSNGYLALENVYPMGINLEGVKISPNTWYTIKYVINFSSQKYMFNIVNETTGLTKTILERPFSGNAKVNNCTLFTIGTSVYGGTWYVDYIRLSKNVDIEEMGFKKGIDPIYIKTPGNRFVPGKINIKKDGIFQYTTVDPYITKDNVIMVTAKNIADILDLSYNRTDNVFSIGNDSKKLLLKAGNLSAVNGDINLSVVPEAKSLQLLVPVKDVCEYFGYKAAFDATTDIIEITEITVKEETE